MEIKALIVDDEPLAQNIIRQYALKMPGLKIAGACNDAICAYDFLQNNQVDLIFLDINMPKLSGISFLKNLKNPPMVIFTTAYSEYALEGFELNAIDYLKKPFSFDRFCKAVFKAGELLGMKHQIEMQHAPEPRSQFLFIKSNKKAYKIDFCDILYIEGLGDYIQVHLHDQKLVTNLSMKKIMDLLPSDQFYRIHKSFIISLSKIGHVEGNMVVINKNKLPIGNAYRQEFLQFIGNYTAE